MKSVLRVRVFKDSNVARELWDRRRLFIRRQLFFRLEFSSISLTAAALVLVSDIIVINVVLTAPTTV
jgi:hypothetical protein